MLKWLRYSWRTIFVAGIGALFSPNVSTNQAAASVAPGEYDGTVVLKRENGSLLISERGGPFERLDLGDTPEAADLWNLLQKLSPDGSAVRVPIDRHVVADGGVSAYKPRPAKKQDEPSSNGQ
jgi:hypothetical protein